MYLLDGPFLFLVAIVITAATIVLAILRILKKTNVSWWIIAPFLLAEAGFWGFIGFVIWAMVG